mmetsp:Transcript_26507/g.41118  ORF Transcript_26507/g.41118 Transcript_26507/m.41118 type:complete len:155 (-) Transcript_26507:75-539(-)|eukprot:CAMPEP_0196801362 /NCGR_PEP_ID=MMETSP1362-20130617/1106_1 /TAXON_ID=163516 /ORGANISM="Leptocylindrus danicus, Strain CCMP1856" /LENGTH=154 /DNA_ID=CAMNT_0042172277 /DNA_START=26 /DNA_END=490 /DNA_ORIENTATION=+
MKTTAIIVAAVVIQDVSAFSTFTGSKLNAQCQSSSTISMEYIPSGMSKEEWKKLKEKEQKSKGKNLGAVGITSFKSRSFADWQKSGGKNLFPVDPKTVKDPSQLPYMQRPGGMPDDSDLKKTKKGGFSFNFGGKKKVEEPPAPEPEKKKNWWTL